MSAPAAAVGAVDQLLNCWRCSAADALPAGYEGHLIPLRVRHPRGGSWRYRSLCCLLLLSCQQLAAHNRLLVLLPLQLVGRLRRAARSTATLLTRAARAPIRQPSATPATDLEAWRTELRRRAAPRI